MNEFEIAAYVGRYVLQRRALLMVDRCNWTGCEADVLAVTKDLRLIDIEIKISRSDFRADRKKDKWWHRWYGAFNPNGKTAAERPPVIETARSHPPKVWKHYFAMPSKLWTEELLEALPSESCGVILLEPNSRGQPIRHVLLRRARPRRDAYRLQVSEAVDIARLASLRIWDAYLRCGR